MRGSAKAGELCRLRPSKCSDLLCQLEMLPAWRLCRGCRVLRLWRPLMCESSFTLQIH